MHARQQSWPRIWMMTDERMGEGLWDAIERLPAGAGIVLRHDSLPADEREELARGVAAIALRRTLCLAIARDVDLAVRLGAELVHNPVGPIAGLPFSRSVHDLSEARAAGAEGAALVFLSPVCATRSHPGQKPLGAEQAGRIAEEAGVPAIALGGMNAQAFASLKSDQFYGWAGIDAWLQVVRT